MEVSATRTISASPEAVFAFLEVPDRHWELLGRRLEPLRAFDGERSRVRLHGPLGVRRTLSISFVSADPPRELLGRVEAGDGDERGAARTIGSVRWTIRSVAGSGAAGDAGAATSAERARAAAGAERAEASEVELVARTEIAGWLDRLLLACGGARWLRGSLELTLRRLDERLR